MRNIKDAMGDASTGKQVLVVDDSEMLRASVRKVCEVWGMSLFRRRMVSR